MYAIISYSTVCMQQATCVIVGMNVLMPVPQRVNVIQLSGLLSKTVTPPLLCSDQLNVSLCVCVEVWNRTEMVYILQLQETAYACTRLAGRATKPQTSTGKMPCIYGNMEVPCNFADRLLNGLYTWLTWGRLATRRSTAIFVLHNVACLRDTVCKMIDRRFTVLVYPFTIIYHLCESRLTLPTLTYAHACV